MDDRLIELYAAVARQALHDFKTGHHRQGTMDAAQWLTLAGLMTKEGEIDMRGITQRRREQEHVT